MKGSASVAGVAGFRRAGRAGARGGLETAASAADPEGRKDLPDFGTPAGRAKNALFAPHTDERLEVVAALLANELIYGHRRLF
jgi:hypothetical protein